MMKPKWGSLSEAFFLATITIIFLWVNACFAGNEWVDYQGTGFNLRIPGDVKVEKTTPVEDFDIFRFFDVSGKQILGIYAGNHPQFPDGVPEGVEQKKAPWAANHWKRLNRGIPAAITVNSWFICKRMLLVILPSLYSFTSGILN